MPKASARTTCPKQPSPRGFPSVSLETKKTHASDLWVPLLSWHPHSQPAQCTCPGGIPKVGREVGLDSQGP